MASGSDGAAAAGPTSLSAPFRVWVQVKDGGSVEYDVDCTWSVSRLLKQVHDGEKLTVGYGKLTLYKSDTKEQALDPWKLVSTIDGGKEGGNPLFVDYPQVEKEEPAEKRSRVAPQNEQCKWLHEAVEQLSVVAGGFAPPPWLADDAVEFEHNILGVRTMGKNLVVRKCYAELYDKICRVWLHHGVELRLVGVCVVTGTPGIGKSVFMAYMAARLAKEGCSIVMQRGHNWMSRKEGEGAVNHEKEEPVALLEDPFFVLLADPMGGENRLAVECRNAGCTIVFTSPHRKNYDTAWKQAGPNQARYFLPLWSEDELIKHREVVLAGRDEEWVKKGHAWLGGSVRRLQQLSAERGDSEEVAKQMIQTSMGRTTYAILIDGCRVDPADVDGLVPESTLSEVLQLHTVDYKDVTMKLLDSDLAITVIKNTLVRQTQSGRAAFLNAAMNDKPLGTLVGRLFQDEVLDKLTAKGEVSRTLEARPLSIADGPLAVKVPNEKFEVQTVAARASPKALTKGILYCPLSDVFPAADLFFVLPNEGDKFTAMLLQTTKNTRHDCKIGAMINQLKNHFNNVALIDAWHWIVVAPVTVASEYVADQKVVGKPGDAVVKQFVVAWPLEP
mmetsp:Transcript_79510/g.257512  ORF Transcript_79510/g.257512 Transcript_79510/m.257512 type:complete len:614 (-) Transcript_79510:473-2314(-)